VSVGESKKLKVDRTVAPEIAERAVRPVPDIVEAAGEVDGTLLRWTLAMSPLERLRNAVKYGRAATRLRGGSA